ncbi:hypothetical protein [Glycomyces paridis]|uniref:Uncharacterized protein n=1 Tax=Glycomyces paridis TaxID=2126555 RepID=A0A4V4HPJ5_9ACTN|nr:hypothetical protein [Glycomyces paridis]THV30166.1 hypothetical protein E9998_07285 [Glycomyces paridis]
MSMVERLGAQVRLAPFPGVAGAWTVLAHEPEVRTHYLAGPEGRSLFRVDARTETAEADLRRFFRFAHQHAHELAEAVPTAAVGGLRLDGYGCDTAISVLPSAAELRPTNGRDPGVDAHVYGLFPGWQCEVTLTESEAAAYNLYRRGPDHARWDREPEPFIAVTFAYRDPGDYWTTYDRPVTVDMNRMVWIFKRVMEADHGWVRCENYTHKAVKTTWDRKLGLVWDAGSTDVPVDPEEIRPRLWSFTTTGR